MKPQEQEHNNRILLGSMFRAIQPRSFNITAESTAAGGNEEEDEGNSGGGSNTSTTTSTSSSSRPQGEEAKTAATSNDSTSTCATSQPQTPLLLNRDSSYTEPLKTSADTTAAAQDLAFSGGSSLRKLLSSSSTRTRVQFQASVSVVEIPSHRDCDHETKHAMWTSLRDLRLNAERNKIEFYADGFDWRNAMEESGMIQCEATGEYMHPATYWLRLDRHHVHQVQQQQQPSKLTLLQQVFQRLFSLSFPVATGTASPATVPPPSNTMKRTQSTMSSLKRLADNN